MQNISAMNTLRNVRRMETKANVSSMRLSSGKRINQAADDGAGSSIVQRMRAQVRGFSQSIRNGQDALSLLQTGESGLAKIQKVLHRMRELSVKAANDTLAQTDRAEIQREIDKLKIALSRIATETEFNRKKLLDGGASVSADRDLHIFNRGSLGTYNSSAGSKDNSRNITLDVISSTGQGQVQKSNLMKFKHGVVIQEVLEVEEVQKEIDVEADIVFLIDVSDLAVHVSESGGGIYTENTHYLGTGQGTVEINYQMYSVPDRMDVFVDDELVASTAADPSLPLPEGLVSGTGTLTFEYNGSTSLQKMAKIVVSATNPGTAWNYSFSPPNAMEEKINDISENLNNFVEQIKKSGVKNYRIGLSIYYDETLETLRVNDDLWFKDLAALRETLGNIVIQGSEARPMMAISQAVNQYDFDKIEGQSHMVIITDKGVKDPENYNNALDALQGKNVILHSLYDPNFDFESVTSELLGSIAGETGGEVADISDDDWENVFVGAIADAIGESSTENVVTIFFEEKIVEIEVEAVGGLAGLNTSLGDLEKFWSQEGVSYLSSPQEIRLVQGNGREARVAIDYSTTIGEFVDRLNYAMGEELGQNKFLVQGSQESFVTFITEPKMGTPGAVEGTFVIRSAIAGREGDIEFVGSYELLQALGLSTITQSRENTYSVRAKDSHSGEVIVEDVKVSGQLLKGLLHPNIDLKIKANTGVQVSFHEDLQEFVFEGGHLHGETFQIHLGDSTSFFHLGPNPLQGLGLNIGDMRASALGIDALLVISRDQASLAIRKIDHAMTIVSSEQGKIGALQNRIQHAMSNMAIARENLGESVSRIEDVDVAREIIVLTKNQILMQSSLAMQAQANLNPQMVLQLFE